jgi:HSP20 family protein
MNFRAILPSAQRRVPARTGDTDPFTAMRREMEKMFDDFGGNWTVPAAAGADFVAPNVNVAETEKGLEISAELPGVDQKDIEVDLTDGILTLKAERKTEKEEKDEKRQYHIVERSYGSYLRRFALPFDADANKVQANLDKGVLHVFVPRQVPVEKPKTKIAIKSGNGK